MFLEKIVRNWYLVHKYENELLQVEFKTKSHNKTDFKSATISCDLETARTDKTPNNANAITFSVADINNRFGYVTTSICDYQSLFRTMLDLFYDIAPSKTLKVYFHNIDFDGYFKLCFLISQNFKEVIKLDEKELEQLYAENGDNQEYFSTLTNNGNIIEIKYSYKGKIIQCWDSYKIWATSLDEVSKECVKINKNDIKNGNEPQFPFIQLKKNDTYWDYEKQRKIGTILSKQEVEYSLNDVLLVNCIYEIFSSFVGTLKMTISSTAFSVCQQSFIDGVFTHDVLVWFLKECFYKMDTRELNSKRFKYFFHVVFNANTNSYDFYSNNYYKKYTEKELLFSINRNELEKGNKTTMKNIFTGDFNYKVIMKKIGTVKRLYNNDIINIACNQSIYFRTYYNQNHFPASSNLYWSLKMFFVPTFNDYQEKAKPDKDDVTVKKHYKMIRELNEEIFPHFTKELDRKIRPAYRGGITQCNELYQNTVVKNVYGLDINSSYPDKMKNEKLPIGTGVSYKHFVAETTNTVVLYKFRCTYQLKENHLPYIATKSFMGNARFKSSDTFENQDKRNEYIYLFANEFKVFKQTHDIKDIYFFESIVYKAERGVFYAFIDKMYEIKQNSKGTALYTPSKVLMNSVYGRYAMDIFRMSETVDNIYIENGKLVFGSQDNPNYDEEKTYGLYLIIACYITACARVHLMQGCYDIINAGGTVYYMDTDSLYFTCDSLKVRKSDKMLFINDRQINIRCDKTILGAWDLEHGIEINQDENFKYYRGETQAKFLCAKRYYLYEKSLEGKLDKDGKPLNPYTIRCAGVSKDEQTKLNKDNFYFGYTSCGLQRHRHETGVELLPTPKILKYSNFIFKTDKGNYIDKEFRNNGDIVQNIYGKDVKIIECIYNPNDLLLV